MQPNRAPLRRRTRRWRHTYAARRRLRSRSRSRARLFRRLPREDAVFKRALDLVSQPGERFFIASVFAKRDKIADPKLQADVKAFCRQEAYHTREHVAYNRALNSFVDADKLERELSEHLDFVKKTLPGDGPLLVTCALEHFTAIMAPRIPQRSGTT